MGFDAVVVGGGISGLAAAHRLQGESRRVVLLEGSPRLGGKVATEHEDGFLIEGGPDSFVTGKGAMLQLAEDLGLLPSVISSRPEHRGSYVWWGDRFHPLPEGLLLMAPSRLRPLLGSSLLSWRGKLRVLADLALPRSRQDGDESLESFVSRRLGREVLERIAEPLIAGIHAAEPATMSLRASFPRFLEMERRYRSLILAARAASAHPSPAHGLSYFASFQEGMGELSAALVRALSGVDIRTRATVIGLSHDRDGYRITMEDGSVVPAQSVVLATPARVASTLLAETVPEAAEAIGGINQVSTATVTLAYRTRDIPPLLGYGFVVPSAQRRRIMGVSYLSHKWEGRVPDSGFTLMRAFVGGPSCQQLASSDAPILEAVVREELEALLGVTARPVEAWAHSWEDGLHQYTLGHVDRVARAESALADHPGVALAGAAFHGIGLNECVASGWRAAEMILGVLRSTSHAPFHIPSHTGEQD